MPDGGLSVGLEVLPGGREGNVSGDNSCGVGVGLRAIACWLLFDLGVTFLCAVCGCSSEWLRICTTAAVKPTPSSSIAAMLAQVLDGVAALRGRLKAAGVVNTSRAYSSRAVAKSNS